MKRLKFSIMASHDFEAYFYIKNDNLQVKVLIKAYLIG